MSREGALWIGGLEPYMDEEYLTKAFNAMGEENVISIKVIRFADSVVDPNTLNLDPDP